MKVKKKTFYIGGWLLYIISNLLLFPLFDVSVMLFSIPLVMLGGWLYYYRGALITTFLTIPYHILMLWICSGDVAIMFQSPQLFGMSIQLFLSLCTALLKANRDRYNQLNNSLKKEVEERTKDLRVLTDYLVQAEEAERIKTTARLLKGPHKSLKDMQDISSQLVQHLNETKRAGHQQAEIIDTLIQKTIIHLQTLNQASESISTAPIDFETTILELTKQLTEMFGTNIKVLPNSGWERMRIDTTSHLYHIIHEALNNAVDHGEASNITVGVEESPDTITVYVQNDGKSMPVENLEGMGLPLMRYRAARIGASLTLEGGPGQDTILKCRIPRAIVT